MKGFFKFLLSIMGLLTAFIGALLIADSFLNKNRIKGDYLDCDTVEYEDK